MIPLTESLILILIVSHNGKEYLPGCLRETVESTCWIEEDQGGIRGSETGKDSVACNRRGMRRQREMRGWIDWNVRASLNYSPFVSHISTHSLTPLL